MDCLYSIRWQKNVKPWLYNSINISLTLTELSFETSPVMSHILLMMTKHYYSNTRLQVNCPQATSIAPSGG